MRSFQNWRQGNNLTEINISKEDFVNICKGYFDCNLKNSLPTYSEHVIKPIIEAVETSRYSVEVNYRTTADESLEGFAKICLGYVSAALKKYGYHTKHVFTEKPLRILVSSRNWDDGEWAGLVTWNPDHSCFVVSKGFYNKNRKTISIQKSTKCTGKSASDITRELHNMMYSLRNEPNNHTEKLKPVPLKRGPKK